LVPSSPSVLQRSSFPGNVRVPLPLTTAFSAFYNHLNFKWLICLITFWEFFKLHELLWRFSSIPSGSPMLQRSLLPGDVQIAEDISLIIISQKHLVEFIVIHVSDFFILFFLIGF
jgi:hypothetical protein